MNRNTKIICVDCGLTVMVENTWKDSSDWTFVCPTCGSDDFEILKSISLEQIDENAEIAQDLDDKKFVKSREAILLLLPKIFPDGSSRFSSMEVLERLIDETVEEIARIWLEPEQQGN
jgi:predicted RNA-binding Zn-ribbon protein involved in translation (DUF1610 family)